MIRHILLLYRNNETLFPGVLGCCPFIWRFSRYRKRLPGTPGVWGKPLSWDDLPVHKISHRVYMIGGVRPPREVAQPARPGTLLNKGQIIPCKRFMKGRVIEENWPPKHVWMPFLLCFVLFLFLFLLIFKCFATIQQSSKSALRDVWVIFVPTWGGYLTYLGSQTSM